MDQNERFWNQVIRQSLIDELIVKEIENYGILKITAKGERFLKRPFSVMLTKEQAPDMDDDEMAMEEMGGGQKGGAVDKALFSLLKDLRKDLSKKEKLPPFVIFQDTSLEDMCIQYPTTMEEITQIVGVGQGKATKYGTPFITLIKKYVLDNEIERPQDLIVKSVVNKSALKVYLIQNIDRKIALEELAVAKNLSFDELLMELESIISSGTKIDINYYIDECVDPYHIEEIFEYFSEATTDSVEEALKELGEDEFTEEEIRLVKIKFMSEIAN
jgi:ATP-dependent DNA helicase RecQ